MFLKKSYSGVPVNIYSWQYILKIAALTWANEINDKRKFGKDSQFCF